LRRRAAGLLGGALVLFFLGSNVQAGWLYVLSAFMLGTLIAGWVLPALMVRRVAVTRSAPVEAFQGRPAEVELVIEDVSFGIRLGVAVEDPHLAPTLAYTPALKPGDRIALRTERTPARRGPQGPTQVVVSSAGPFGVAVARRRIELEGQTLVFPEVVPLGPLPFVHAADTHERSVHPYPRMGQGPEFMGIREYRPGDGMRNVHWPSTARHGTLIVREFEEETTRRLALIVDTTNDVGTEWTPLDRCCSAAASIAMSALTQGHGARLIAAREGTPDVLARADESQMLDWLARLRPGGGLPLPDLIEAIGDELRGIRTVVVAFPTWRINTAPVISAAASRLFELVDTVVTIVVEIDPDLAPKDSVLSSGAMDNLARTLRAVGAEVYRWAPADELAGALQLGAGVR
jgi:uncharacterized protein (DUF58 family)